PVALGAGTPSYRAEPWVQDTPGLGSAVHAGDRGARPDAPRATGSGPRDGLQAPGIDRVPERPVVAFVLLGVPLREVVDGPVEGVGLSEVLGDGDRVARARVGAGEGPPAQLRVVA